MSAGKETVRLAALADPHYGKASRGSLLPVLGKAGEEADVLLIAGDLTNSGLAEEARVLAKDLALGPRIPVIAVLGNHDYEAGQSDEISRVLSETGVKVLDGEAWEVLGIGFAGTKGFAGGFDERALAPWGEEVIKHFVREAVDEALKLESALARLRTPRKVVLLHYAPIRATVEGEPLEVFPFLGSSRLEDPLNRFAVTAVFHGHAHRGQPEGRTKRDIPVYNVAMTVLGAAFPERPGYRLVEISPGTADGDRAPGQPDFP